MCCACMRMILPRGLMCPIFVMKVETSCARPSIRATVLSSTILKRHKKTRFRGFFGLFLCLFGHRRVRLRLWHGFHNWRFLDRGRRLGGCLYCCGFGCGLFCDFCLFLSLCFAWGALAFGLFFLRRVLCFCRGFSFCCLFLHLIHFFTAGAAFGLWRFFFRSSRLICWGLRRLHLFAWLFFFRFNFFLA